MLVNNLGFIFECRKDANGKIGIMGNYKVITDGDKVSLTLVCAVDNSGKTVVPSRINMSCGFEPLSAFCETEEDVKKFIRSNKPHFYSVDEIAMVASGTIVFDKNTGEVVSFDSFGFYIPVTTSKRIDQIKDNKGVVQPALICEKVSTRAGLNTFKVTDLILKAYKDEFLKTVTLEVCKDKEAYFERLLKQE
jgi:hypothetical protein